MNIIQIGCFKSLDKHIEAYARNPNHTIHLVDANPRIKIENTSNLFYHNYVVTTTNDICKFYITPNGLDHDYIASVHTNHLAKHGQDQIIEVEVQGITLEALINKLGLQKVDILYIDAEGEDLRILDQASKLDIDAIVYEANHIAYESDYIAILQRFLDAGYKLHSYDVYNNALYKDKLPLFQ